MTNDKKQPGLPVVEVDQAFPLMTTDGVSRPATSTGITGDQGPAVSAAIRDVLGWRPRVQDPKAFTAALSASFDLSIVEDHVVARYVPRGVAVQADLGGVTGGQASLYLRAKAAHEQITRMLDSLQPLRTDADPQDCEAYRGLVRDSVRRIVMELGREGGPRVPLVDSAFSVLTGYQPSPQTPPPATGTPRGFTPGSLTGLRPGLSTRFAPSSSFAITGSRGQSVEGSVPAAVAEIDPDRVPGQLGALRDRFGLDDDHVNTVDEEKQRTSFWTLVELVTDLQRSWDLRRRDFTLGAGSGFLGTDLVQISRLLAAAAEQVDEFEAVLDSVLVSAAERQTVVLDLNSGLTLDDLVQWLRVFFSEDGPNIIRDTGRDGLVSSFTPTAVALLLTLREKLVRMLVPCAGAGCAGGCTCGSRGLVTCIPLGCCTKLPPGMYAGRVKIAVSTLCGLVERLTAKAIRIGRFAGAVLLDLAVVPFKNGTDFVRMDVRGLHLRATYLPAFIATGGDPADPAALVLPLQGSASADADSLSGIFQRSALPDQLLQLLGRTGTNGIVMAASEVPLAIVDGELGRIVQGPAVTTWPRLQPAGVAAGDGGPDVWDEYPPNQRFVPQSPLDPVAPVIASVECLDECDDDCAGCDCECHADEKQASLKFTGARLTDQDLADLAAIENAAAELITEAKVTANEAAAAKTLADKVATDTVTAEKTAVDQAATDKAAADKAANDLAAAEKKAADLVVAAKTAADQAANKNTPPARAAATRAANALAAAETDVANLAVAAKAAANRADAAKAGAETAAAEKAVAEKAAAEKAAAERSALRRVAAAEAAAKTATTARVEADQVVAEKAAAKKAAADQGAARLAGGAGGQVPAIRARSQEEVSALEQVRQLTSGTPGGLESRVSQIQDTPEIRRFVVAALLAADATRTAGGLSGKGQ